METGEAALIMEDLREKGYGMADRFKTIDLPHARLVMESLGRLHAISFALKIQKPELFNQFMYKDILCEMFVRKESKEVWKQFFTPGITSLLPEEATLKSKLEAFRDDMAEEIMKLIDPEVAEPYSVLNHGDCWFNNFLFHRVGNVPTNIKFIDYQISRYVSPVIDLVYFIFSSTDKIFRDQHYDELIKIYHNALCKLLKRFGEDPLTLFPYEVLLKQLKQFGKFGLPMALMLIPVMTTAGSDIPDLDKFAEAMQKAEAEGQTELPDEMKELNEQFYKNSERTNARARDVILDMVRLGYF